jgi:hypothetical protein
VSLHTSGIGALFQLTSNVTVPEFTSSPDTFTPFGVCANSAQPPPSPLPRRGSSNKARRITHILTGEDGWFFLKILVFIYYELIKLTMNNFPIWLPLLGRGLGGGFCKKRAAFVRQMIKKKKN